MITQKKNKIVTPRQVELQGKTIDLAEVERYLSMHRDIKDTLVTVVENRAGIPVLCAYLVPFRFDALHFVDFPALRLFLSERLPFYMIPVYFVLLDALPYRDDGIVEKDILPMPELPGVNENVLPRNDVQRKLGDAWCRVLNLEKGKVGIHDNFFDRGGGWDDVPTLVNEIYRLLGVKAEPVEIVCRPTIREMAKFIQKKKDEPG